MSPTKESTMPEQITPPTEDQKRHARAVLEPLTDTQRRAVYAVVAYETARELAEAEGYRS